MALSSASEAASCLVVIKKKKMEPYRKSISPSVNSPKTSPRDIAIRSWRLRAPNDYDQSSRISISKLLLRGKA
jgi:hypothetical protein